MDQNINKAAQPGGWPERKAQALARQAEHNRKLAEAGAANCEGPYIADGSIGIVSCLAIAVLTIAIIAAMVEVFA